MMHRPSIIWSILWTVCLVSLFKCDPLTKQENTQRLSSCGLKTTSKVWQGRNASQSEAPWSVYLLYHTEEHSAEVCTGTVISSRHILTATHCFADMDLGGWKEKLKYDKKNCKDGHYVIEDKSLLEKVHVKSDDKYIARSPERVTFLNGCDVKNVKDLNEARKVYEDVAIIDLYEDLNFSNMIQMACVSSDKDDHKADTTLDYFGFGLNPKIPNSQTGVLRHETIKVEQNNRGYEQPRSFVAKNADGKTIACVGDSGGGSMVKIAGRTTVAGVLAQTSCANPAQRQGDQAAELYSSVAYYYETICKMTGICKAADYDTHHQGYVRKPKPIRTTPAPKITILDENNNPIDPAIIHQQQQVYQNQNSGNAKKYGFVIVLMSFLCSFGRY